MKGIRIGSVTKSRQSSNIYKFKYSIFLFLYLWNFSGWFKSAIWFNKCVSVWWSPNKWAQPQFARTTKWLKIQIVGGEGGWVENCHSNALGPQQLQRWGLQSQTKFENIQQLWNTLYRMTVVRGNVQDKSTPRRSVSPLDSPSCPLGVGHWG
jgi:hypothetical protein